MPSNITQYIVQLYMNVTYMNTKLAIFENLESTLYLEMAFWMSYFYFNTAWILNRFSDLGLNHLVLWILQSS